MRIEDSLYGHYYDLKGLGLEDEVNNDLKVPQEKWYNLVMNGKIREFDDFLLNCEDLRDLKIYHYIMEFQGFLKTFANDYTELFCGNEKYEYLTKAMKIKTEQLENKKDKLSSLEYKTLIKGYEEYFLLLDQWDDIINFDINGEKLASSEDFSDCSSLKQLVDAINYYNSIRSNPVKEQIEDSKLLIKDCYKYVRQHRIKGDNFEEIKEYLTMAESYLDVLLYLLEKKQKIENKIKQSNTRRC